MRLSELAQAFARLEAGRARLPMIEIIATLLARAGRSERAALVYLLQGQLRPPYEGVELGLGERLIARALGEVYGASSADVARRMRRLGDLGSVAESLARRANGRALTVGDTHARLLAIAEVQGSGSVAEKQRLLCVLLGRASALEAKYLVRIAQGRLRLGVGDQTIVEAIAHAALGDRRQKKLVEHAYAVRPDLGEIAALAFTKGARTLASLAPRVGVPVRPALAQRLPSAGAILERLHEADVEPKYDGFRLQLHRDGERVWAFSRRLENVTAMFPDLARALTRQLRARRGIIEGEALAYDARSGRFQPFQVTITRKRRHDVEHVAARYPLRLFAFDLLSLNGESLLATPERERHRRLVRAVRETATSTVHVTESRAIHGAPELQRYFEAQLARGLEGIVAKRPDAPYRAGERNFDWVKLKRAYQSALRDTVDVVLVGYLAGRGKRAVAGIGSLLGAVYDPEHDRFRTVCKIGSGPTDDQWRALRPMLDARATAARPARVDSRITPDVWVEPTYVVEVLADEITRSPLHTCGSRDDSPGYALRFPRMLDGVRADRRADDATTEREIISMFRQQSRPPHGR